MRKIFLAMMLLCSSTVSATDIKIGAVDPAKVLEKAPQAEVARSLLEQEFADRDKELVKMQDEYRTKEDDLAKNALMMSADQRSSKERELRTLQRDIQRFQEAFRDDLNIRRNEEFGKLQREIYEAIVKLAEDDGYDLILSEGVIFASGKVDLSDKLIKVLEAKFAKQQSVQ